VGKLPKLTKRVWRSFASKFREDVAAVIASNPAAFNEDYLKAISEKIKDIEKTTTKIWLVNITIIGALFLQLTVRGKSFTILSLDFSDVTEAREILLFISVSLSLIVAFYEWTKFDLVAIKDVLSAQLYPDKDVRLFKSLSLPAFYMTPSGRLQIEHGNLILTWPGFFLGIVPLIVFFFCLIAAMVMPLTVQLITAYEVLVDPKLSPTWNILFVIWTIGSAIGYFGLFFCLHLPLPHNDRSLLRELDRMKAQDEKAYEEMLRKILRGEIKP
jgi:hypothetical protein